MSDDNDTDLEARTPGPGEGPSDESSIGGVETHPTLLGVDISKASSEDDVLEEEFNRAFPDWATPAPAAQSDADSDDDDAEEPEEESDAQGNKETNAPVDSAPHAIDLSDTDRKVLEAIGFDPQEVEDWPAARVRDLIEHNRSRISQQSGNDGMGSKGQEGTERGQSQAESIAKSQTAGIRNSFDTAFESLSETFGDDLAPLKTAFDEIANLTDGMRDTLDLVMPMANAIEGLAIDLGMERLAHDYPSLKDKADARNRLLDSFRKVDISKCEGNSPQERVLDGLRQAARATFTETERSAKLSLAERNTERVKSQPRTGKSKEATKAAKAATKPQATNEDKMYDDAFARTMQPALEERQPVM